ncbi:MAG TPA: CoA pyrophosphatase [Candidatus Eremiobacteraceae bacterium]
MRAGSVERLRAIIAARARRIFDAERDVDHTGGYRPAPVRRAAVLVSIVGGEESPQLLLFERTLEVADHKGEICFPGGSIEQSDVDPVSAALREAKEELGIDPADVTVLGCLDDVHAVNSNYVITPVVGHIETMPALVPDSTEVARPIVISVADLSAPGAWTLERIKIAGVIREFEAHRIDGGLIWGATARILRSFLAIWKEAQA